MREIRESYVKYIVELNGEYEKKFALVDTYCQYLLEGVDMTTKEEIMSSILDSFLSAQTEGVPVDTVIGNDIAKFCENACSEIPFKYKIKKIILIIAVYSMIQIPIILINIFIDIFGGTKSLENILYWKTDIDFMLFCPLTALFSIIYLSLRKRQLKKEVQKGIISEKSETTSVIISLLVPFFIISFISNINMNFYIWIVLPILIFFIVLYKIIYRKNVKYDMDVTESLSRAIIENSENNLKAINEKRNKKGKTAFSEEQFLEYSIKECKKQLNITKFHIAIFLCIALPLSLFGESFLDKLTVFGMLFAIFLLFELPMYFFFNRTIRRVNRILLKKYTYFKDNKVKMKDWK